MIITILAATLVVLALPFLISGATTMTRKVVYEGPATPVKEGLKDLGQRTNTKYLWFVSPGGDFYLAEVTPQRYAQIESLKGEAYVTVTSYGGSKPEVESFRLAGEEANSSVVEGTGKTLVFALTYLAGAFLALLFGLSHAAELDGTVAMFASALMFAATGFSLHIAKGPKAKVSELAGSMLGIPLGKGMASIMVMLAIAVVLTLLCFGTKSVFILFPGIHAAFGVGGLIAILINCRQAT